MRTLLFSATIRKIPGRRRNGLSLAEITAASLITGFLLVSSLMILGNVTRGRRLGTAAADGPLLARQLLTEVLGCPYTDPEGPAIFGREAGEPEFPANRTAFDDVDDYANWVESPPRNAAGQSMADYTGWTRSVSIEHINLLSPGSIAGAETGLRRITVTVTPPVGNPVMLSGLRSQHGVHEKQPSVPVDYVATVDVTLQPTGVRAAQSGTTVFSQVPQ